MPIYVYGCHECGAVEEHIQRFSDPPLTECSSCGGRLEKQVTAAAFQLKGGGWYKDLYSSSKPDKGGDSGGTGGSSDSSGSKGGSDSSGSKGGSSSGSSGSGSSGSGSSGSSAAE
jgi:putative FmdB family regulatory protein